MEDDMLTSGFVGEDIFTDVGAFSDIQEIYVSASGYNRLFRCQRYGRLHVLKTLQPFYAGKDFYEQALRKEFNIGYPLEHPHICRTLGWEQIPALGRCILMEYIDGISLKEFMEQGKLTRSLASKFIAELCSALQYLHSKQIVHRDLKPGNILITHNGNNVKLIDFGLSDCDDYDILKMPAGTRYYLAPEALQPDAALDLRADIYSLGVIIGEMASLLRDKKLASISKKCTQRRPEKRYASAAEVACAIDSGNPPPMYKYAVGSMVLIGVLTAFFFTWGSNRTKAEPIPFPVYGNLSGSDACRRMIASERIRLHRQLGASVVDGQQISEDSLRLMNRLKETMEAEYPLVQQQTSAAYRKQWEELQKEVAQEWEELRKNVDAK